MADDPRPTRRQVITGTTTPLCAALAGCGSTWGSTGTEAESTDESTETATETASTTVSNYEACIEPVGCTTFEEVPETYIVNNGEWADMAFALGQRDGLLTATNMTPGFLFEPFGLDVPPEEELSQLSTTNWDKELFFELDPDVILIDPNYMHKTGWDDSWDRSDTEELREQVAPFFGNNILRRREFHDYKLHSLYGALERLAELFQEQERYQAFKEVHEEVQQTVADRLPPADERPSAAMINSASQPSEGTFYTMSPQAEGVETKTYRDLDIGSAFPDSVVENGTIDYERFLEVDPEIIVVHWGIGITGDSDTFSQEAFRERYVKPLEEDPVGSQLTAVEEGNVYPGAHGSQGPLVNLLQTELTAQQLFPEEFGEFEPERFPEVVPEKQLFDRQRVKDIVAGRL